MALRLSMANVDEKEIDEIKKVFFETVNFGLGVHVQQFEAEIQKLIGVETNVICVNTGTSALHLALEALNFPKGSEILVPSITFVASYSAISAAGLVPVSCEVTFPDCHICPIDAEKRITSKTVGIMPVAYSGTDFDREYIYKIAEKYNLRVIEDDAHAFGSFNKEGVLFGGSGDIVCFSFDGIKNITCGEGGAIVTKDAKLAHKLRVMRSLGIEKDVELRYLGQRAWEYDVATQGYRYHMSNINAAIGLSQLKKLPHFISVKKELVKAYVAAIKEFNLTEKLVFTQKNYQDSCLHIFSCLLPQGIERNTVREFLKKQGFESGFHYVPNHLHTMYKTASPLPIAEDIGSRLLSLPFHPAVTEQDCFDIIKALSQIL